MLRSRLRSTGGVISHLFFYQNKFYRQELIIAIEFDYNLEKDKAIFIYMIELIIFYDYVAQCNFFEDICIRCIFIVRDEKMKKQIFRVK